MQSDYGLMKSGWLLTLSANSAAQFLQASVAWQRMQKMHIVHTDTEAPYLWAMGDDMLLRMPEDEIQYYPEVLAPPGRRHWNDKDCDCQELCFVKYGLDMSEYPRREACTLAETIKALKASDGEYLYRQEYAEFLHWYGAVLGTTGCLVKHVIPAREFAGFTFGTSGTPEPLYANKHKFMLKHVRDEHEQETLKSFVLLYALVPGYGWLGEWLHRADFPIGPHFKAWALGVATLKNFLSPKEVNFVW